MKKSLAVIVGLSMMVTQVFAVSRAEPLPVDSVQQAAASAGMFTRADAEMELQELEEKASARYIVKLRQSNALAAETGLEETAVQVFEKLRIEKAEKAAEITAKINESEFDEPLSLPAAVQSLDTSDTVTLQPWRDGYQLLTLPEAVEAEAFAAQVSGGAYEYIQPDYQLELQAEEVSGVSLEVEIAGDEQDEPEAEEAEDAGESVEEMLEPTEETLEEAPASEESTEPEEELQPSVDPTPGSGVTVAVIDSGIDVTHPMLADKLAGGWDFVNDTELIYDETARDQYFHGTHVAGIIAQTAPGAQILPLKVFENGKAYTSDIIEAIEYAENAGAAAVNCSFGSTDDNLALKEAMEASDMLFVCAAGNHRMDVDETPIYPACFELDNILSVTSLNEDLGFSYYSNYGTGSVDIAAKGREVESAYPGGGTGPMSGTSMAAGYVTAAAAIAGDSAREKILDSADRLSNLSQKVAGSRALNLDNLFTGTSGSDRNISPADDFDVHGYQRTPQEDWELFCSLDTIQVAAGGNFTLALKADGTVWSWGSNQYGQLGDGTTISRGTPAPVVGLSDVKKIVAGTNHAFAITETNRLFSWGANSYGQLGINSTKNTSIPTYVLDMIETLTVDAGAYHSVAVTLQGRVFTWGYNSSGQLGNTTGSKYLYAHVVPGLYDIIDAVAGENHTLALGEDGSLWAWGANSYGQLGDGTTTKRTEPQLITNFGPVKQLTAGSSFSAALLEDGTVYTWGDNFYGQLGDEMVTRRTTPAPVPGLTGIKALSASTYQMAALAQDDTLLAWGSNSSGQLGDGTTMNRAVPISVSGLTNIASFSTGAYHMAAVTENGSVCCWGSNGSGQLGDGAILSASMPMDIPLSSEVETVTSGATHTFALSTSRTLFGWGSNNEGQLGHQTSGNVGTPTQVYELTNDVTAVAAGTAHTIAVNRQGTVYTWGDNSKGQLGRNNFEDRILPGTTYNNLTDVKAVAAGDYHSIALKEDGTVYTWGANSYGQLGNRYADNAFDIPQLLSSFTDVKAVAAGAYHTVALKEDGTVYAWGANSYGQLGNGETANLNTPTLIPGLSDVIAIAAGANHTIALKSDGTVWAWGANSSGQLGIGTIASQKTPVQVTGLTGITGIAAGANHTIAWNDTKCYTWGQNSAYQLGDGTNVNKQSPVLLEGLGGIQAADGGTQHTIVVKMDGSLAAWGSNSAGQLGDGRQFLYAEPYQLNGIIADTAGNSFDDAHEIQVGAQIAGAIDTLDDTDWYRFDVEESDTFRIHVTESVQATLYDSTQAVLTAGTDGGYALAGGSTYYVCVSGNQIGSYTLRISGSLELYNYTYKLGVVNSTPITHLQSGFVTAGVTVRNNHLEGKQVTLIVALRKKADDSLVNVATTQKLVSGGSEDMLTGGFNVPSDVQNYKMEITVWDSLTNMELIASPVVFQ